MGVIVEGKPTLAGVMTFFRYLQTYFPQLCITAIIVLGTEISELRTDGSVSLTIMTGAIPDMLKEAMEFILKTVGQRRSLVRMDSAMTGQSIR